ncbi:MAG: hypothetical protein NTY94_20100 [Alphaproteobacteria bacterium]|nr:hypothetical protein [Alphaproteobacteria bacterium]
MTLVRAVLAAAVLLGSASAAGAAVLKVGPGEALPGPGAAARVAKDGDTIEFAPGEYYDCGVFYQQRLTFTGPTDPATPAVLTDMTCQGKAILVIGGADVTVRHLTFARARVGDGNGAGIRAEGRGLTVEHSRFVNNQSGILSAPQPDATISVRDSVFERNGVAGERCVPTLDIGETARLVVERSRFLGAKACDVVRARGVGRTEVIDSRFEDGPGGEVRHLVLVEGGGLLVRGSSFARGPQAEAAAVVLRDLSGHGSGAEIRDSVLENGSGRKLVLLHALTPKPAVVAGNTVGARDTELDQSGYWTAWARGSARAVIDTGKQAAGAAKRAVRSVLPF